MASINLNNYKIDFDKVTSVNAIIAYDMIYITFKVLEYHWGDKQMILSVIHEQNKDKLTDSLRKNPGFSRLIFQFFNNTPIRIKLSAILQNPSILNNIMAFLNIVLVEFSVALSGSAKEQTISRAKFLLDQIASDYISAINPQIFGLKSLLSAVTKLNICTQSDEEKIVILEFPVGNSLPAKLLNQYLKNKGYKVSILMIALTRNDSKLQGITREKLLEDKLSKALNSGDIVLYVDEWISGSNFNNLCSLVSKIIDKLDVKFVPIGLLAHNAEKNPRWGTYTKEHDKYLHRLGLHGADYRIPFEPILKSGTMGYPFFWSEYDRISGYRKMQLYGSIYSSLIEAVEKIAKNRMLRQKAYNYVLKIANLPNVNCRFRRLCGPIWVRIIAVILKITKLLPGSIPFRAQKLLRPLIPIEMIFIEFIEKKFFLGYKVYLAKKQELEKLDHSSNTQPVENIETCLAEIADQITEVLGDKNAELCISVALLYERIEGVVDPVNRYHFKNHVPLVVNLEKESRILHEVVMDKLNLAMSNDLQPPGHGLSI